MPDTKVRVSQELYAKLKQLADKSGKSMRELVDEAIRAYLLGSTGIEGKEIKGITAKIIPLQYPAKCRRCGRQLNPGELAYWVKITYTDNSVRSFIYCLDCYYQSSALKEHYLKKRQLEKIIKELKKEADQLADRVLELRRKVQLYSVVDEIDRLIREIYDLLGYVLDKERRDALQQIMQRLEAIEEKMTSIADALEALEAEAQSKVRKVRGRARSKGYY